MSEFSRVNHKNKCPICDKPDWCYLINDGELVCCMRECGGSIKQANGGGYIHVLTPHASYSKQTTRTTATIGTSGNVESIRASVRHRNEVYRAMLEMLTLSEKHANDLLKRGLSDTTIANNLYASVPSQWVAKGVSKELSSRFNLRGIPGFYYENGHWRLNKTGGGFFVPYRNVDGLISGLQVRRDIYLPGYSRYLWLSSSKQPFGCSPKSLLHFVKPDLARKSGTIHITEGALKADCISDFKDCAAIAVAGVSGVAPDKLISELRQNLPEVKKVLIAFDADWREKKHVKNKLVQLVKAVDAAGFDGDVMQWDALLGKGLDDVLAKGEGK